jgi:hypothetical protein
VIWLSTRVTPSILARRAARLFSAAVGTSPVSVATPPATSTSMSASFSVVSASHFFSIESSSRSLLAVGAGAAVVAGGVCAKPGVAIATAPQNVAAVTSVITVRVIEQILRREE